MSHAYELPLITLKYIHQVTQNLLKEPNGNRQKHSTFHVELEVCLTELTAS